MSRDDPTETEALALLRGAGLLPPQGGTIAWRRSLRHHVLLAAGDDPTGATWFVKHCGDPIGAEELTLRWESAFHRWIGARPRLGALRRHVPDLVLATPDGRWLVFRGARDPRPLSEALAEDDAAGEALLPALGRLIATLHAASAGDAADTFPDLPAPVQTFGRLAPETVAAGGQAFIELATLMQSQPELNRRLRELRASWRRTALVHGDLKSDNALIVAGTQGPEPLLVDWECAGIGDPAWDCGSAIGSACFAWVRALAPRGDTAALRRHARRVIAGIDGFWSAYADARGEDDPGFAREFEASLAFRWAGFWLVQRVMAKLPLRPSLSAQDICALQIASALLAGDPAEAGQGTADAAGAPA